MFLNQFLYLIHLIHLIHCEEITTSNIKKYIQYSIYDKNCQKN